MNVEMFRMTKNCKNNLQNAENSSQFSIYFYLNRIHPFFVLMNILAGIEYWLLIFRQLVALLCKHTSKTNSELAIIYYISSYFYTGAV